MLLKSYSSAILKCYTLVPYSSAILQRYTQVLYSSATQVDTNGCTQMDVLKWMYSSATQVLLKCSVHCHPILYPQVVKGALSLPV